MHSCKTHNHNVCGPLETYDRSYVPSVSVEQRNVRKNIRMSDRTVQNVHFDFQKQIGKNNLKIMSL